MDGRAVGQDCRYVPVGVCGPFCCDCRMYADGVPGAVANEFGPGCIKPWGEVPGPSGRRNRVPISQRLQHRISQAGRLRAASVCTLGSTISSVRLYSIEKFRRLCHVREGYEETRGTGLPVPITTTLCSAAPALSA